MAFVDRVDAGRRLAAELAHLRGEAMVVLGLPRGGVPVAAEVARALDAPLDVIVVRKLGVPSQPELGMGAIGENGVRILNPEVVGLSGVTERQLEMVEARERAELERRALRYRGGRPRLALEGRTAVVVDDGIATGSTARAACQVARAHGAARVVLAVPVAPPGWAARFAGDADERVAVETPSPFFAIGQFYDDFSQISDQEVVDRLERARRHTEAPAGAPGGHVPGSAAGGASVDVDVTVPAGRVRLGGRLTLPDPVTGLVVFAHGSGSSRLSPRNRSVATVLNHAGLGTLLFDLLTAREEHDRANVFDVDLLAGRLVGVTRWLRSRPDVA
ncbi:MAG TPA: phosphoribosyltransferase, partial [Acidimicrobiales bacterium]|nr:phosphoribosyltransferase [Acidimicrobiales bacterium]